MMGQPQGTNYGLLGQDPTTQMAMGLLAAGGPQQLPMSGAAGMPPMGGMGMMPQQGMAPQGTPQGMPQGPGFANILQQLQQRMMAPGGAVPTPGGLGAPGGQMGNQMGGLSPQLMQLLMGAGAQR